MCNKKLCQYKHNQIPSSESGEPKTNESIVINIGHKDCEKDNVDQNPTEVRPNRNAVTSSQHISTAEENYVKGRDIFCKHYCSTKYNFHVHEKEDIVSYNGVQMDKITEDKDNKFMKLFPCTQCDIISKGLVKHRQHFESSHGELEFSLRCLLDQCEFNTKNSKIMMKHIGEKHGSQLTG